MDNLQDEEDYVTETVAKDDLKISLKEDDCLETDLSVMAKSCSNCSSNNIVQNECDQKSADSNIVNSSENLNLDDELFSSENKSNSEISDINSISSDDLSVHDNAFLMSCNSLPNPELQNESCINHNENISPTIEKEGNSGKSEDFRYVSLENENKELCLTIQYYKSQFEDTQQSNIILKNELSDTKVQLLTQDKEFKKLQSKIKTEFLPNIEKLSKECIALRKERETIVLRYANSEKELILEKKTQSDSEKKIRDLIKERETLLVKIRSLTDEKNRMSSTIDSKTVELAKTEKEKDKMREDLNSREIKIKWLQNKLTTETMSHQETQTKLDHNLHRLNEMREEAEQVRKDCQDMIKCYQEAEEIKSVKLDGQLKQKLSELEVQKREKSDQEQVYQLLRQELDALKKKQRMTMEENHSLTLKTQVLEKQRLEYEQTLSKLKDSQNSLTQQIVDLTAKLAEMESIELQLEREKEKSAANQREIERLRSTNAELQADMEACHLKEGDLLKFTETCTEKMVYLQSEHCMLEVKTQALEEQLLQVNKALIEVQQKYLKVSKQFENCQEEIQLLSRKLAEKTKKTEDLNTRLDEAENENRVMKRRHLASIKELSRELFQCKKNLETYEIRNGERMEFTSLGSQGSSSTSLDILSYCSPRKQVPTFPPPPPIAFSGGKMVSAPHDKVANKRAA